MPFDSKDLSVLAYANGFTLWHYKTDDANVDQSGYFNSASDLLQSGDMILANLSVGKDCQASFVHIKEVDEGAVSVS